MSRIAIRSAAQNKTTCLRSVSIVGTGSYLPERVLTNADLAKMVDTSDEWIMTRTGIKERHIAAKDEATSDLAIEAARRALAQAGVAPQDLDMILVATITPDMFFPSTACFVQKSLGAVNAACFDLQAACSGFLYALETGRQFIASGSVDTVLIIGAEKLSCITDWEDRSTCVLFGDGAGAAVLQNRPGTRGILSSVMGSDGNLSHLLSMPGGGSRNPASEQTVKEHLHFLKMAGKEVFKYAVNSMLGAAKQALEQCALTIDQVDCIIPHQANVRIVQAIGERLGAPLSKYYLNLPRTGNMSAASIPVALDEAVRAGFIHQRDVVLLVAFGGGFTWAAAILEW
ncbi:MAG: ketoacyl-ACP synthase III [Verrucomicrobia bacterium]|nr:ketoacyl-ACP synthase III [Verrucomicrobiota bacterium]MBU4290749.1 ketoacyl-ACP synthase III [Verrucomicrobiota bacterium]MBU4428682.1 ketoacyl-ACP synthase III [Verrucomicrobiota bacterium]MCG2679767.1 ketoacyl-ACP synthase III [Kiritimatiellia bacterium]